MKEGRREKSIVFKIFPQAISSLFIVVDFILLLNIFLMISFLKYPALYLGEKKISDEKRNNVYGAFSFMESFLEGRKWFCGENLTLADLSICASMSSIIVSRYAMKGKLGVTLRRAKKD